MAKQHKGDNDTLPCGHSRKQAERLGCTENECRPMDEKISRAYWMERGGHPRYSEFQHSQRMPRA
jgi:hypothetical protein